MATLSRLNLAQGVSIVDCATLSGNPHDFSLVLVASPTAIMQVVGTCA